METTKRLGASKTTQVPKPEKTDWSISHGDMVELLKSLDDRLNSLEKKRDKK